MGQSFTISAKGESGLPEGDNLLTDTGKGAPTQMAHIWTFMRKVSAEIVAATFTTVYWERGISG
jgi:hypothetical protein